MILAFERIDDVILFLVGRDEVKDGKSWKKSGCYLEVHDSGNIFFAVL